MEIMLGGRYPSCFVIVILSSSDMWQYLLFVKGVEEEVVWWEDRHNSVDRVGIE